MYSKFLEKNDGVMAGDNMIKADCLPQSGLAGNKPTGGRYGALDGLRAYCALGIVMMHVLANIAVRPQACWLTVTLIPWFTDFTLLFMMISGFSMCCGYYKRVKEGTVNVNDFYRKRYMRILPFFACLCLVSLVAEPSWQALRELLANLTLCFNLIPDVDIKMIGVGWFVGVVFVFYLLFPFFVFLIDNKKRAFCSLAIALLLACVCAVWPYNSVMSESNVGRQNMVYVMPLFITGGIIYLYRGVVSRFVTCHPWLCAVATVCSVAGFLLVPSLRQSPVSLLLSELALFAIVLAYALGSRDRVLNNGVVRFLGGISMEIYLCHMLCFRVVERLSLSLSLSLSGTLANGNVAYVVTVLLVALAAVALSWVMKRRVLPLLFGLLHLRA